MNRIYSIVFNFTKGLWQVAAAIIGAHCKRKSRKFRRVFAITGVLLLIPIFLRAADLPQDGSISAGSGSISQSDVDMHIRQETQKMAIDWQSFDIGQGNSVNFDQPGTSAIALNRVLGSDASQIYGALNANGQVFLLNPNGVLFGSTAQVDVGALVASTRNLSNADFLDGNYQFFGTSTNAIVNQGNIQTADGGYVAMIAAQIINEGNIAAQQGSVHMASGDRVTLDLGGPVKLEIEQGTLDGLIDNGAAISADGGLVYLSAKAAGDLASSVINNEGIIEAQSLQQGENGSIMLMGDMEQGEVKVSGTLDASAPNGGDGGFIETSAAKVDIKPGLVVTTKAEEGQTGEWLMDPTNVWIVDGVDESNLTGSDPTTNDSVTQIHNATIQEALSSTNVTIKTPADGSDAGDVTVNAPVDWDANTLTLSAHRNININADLVATSDGTLSLLYGQATSDGGESRYSVAEGVDVLIPTATAFTWRKGSAGTPNNLVFENQTLRFGDGAEASINDKGLLLQPFFYTEDSSTADFYKLTYSTYPLDFMLGVGGSEYADGNLYHSTNGSLDSASSNFSINISEYFEKTGTVRVAMDVDTTEGILPVSHEYSLEQGSDFLKATTSITNQTSADVNNLRLWVGTQDDWIVNSDWNFKTRGGLGNEGFVPVDNQTSDVAKVLVVSENALDSGDGASVLFYSTKEGVNAIVGDSYRWSNIIGADPDNQEDRSGSAGDNSYALYLDVGNLSDASQADVTWYYAASPVDEIDNAASQVGESSGAIDPSTPEPEPEPESTDPALQGAQQSAQTVQTMQPTPPAVREAPAPPPTEPRAEGAQQVAEPVRPNGPIVEISSLCGLQMVFIQTGNPAPASETSGRDAATAQPGTGSDQSTVTEEGPAQDNQNVKGSDPGQASTKTAQGENSEPEEQQDSEDEEIEDLITEALNDEANGYQRVFVINGGIRMPEGVIE